VKIDEIPDLSIREASINDGILDMDIDADGKTNDEPLARIVVSYLAGMIETPKHALAAEDEDEPQRKKLKRGHTIDGSDGGIPDYTTVDSYIKSTSPHAISSMKRLNAHRLCVSRELPGYPEFKPTLFLQESLLELKDMDDLAIASRISEYLLQHGTYHFSFKNDTDATLKLMRASIKGVDGWSLNDVQEFCKVYKLDGPYPNLEKQQLQTLVVEQKKHEIKEIGSKKASLKEESSINGYNSVVYEDMSIAALRSYCIARSLPAWGTRRALVARVQRNERGNARSTAGALPLVRAAQTYRTTKARFERYVFKALLGRCSVTSLKSALFLEANLHPEATLKLFFYPDESLILEDEKPLNEYKGKDWTALTLKVTSDAGNTQEALIGRTDPGKPEFDWKSNLRKKIQLSSYQDVASKTYKVS
jgi:hypothetical protein